MENNHISDKEIPKKNNTFNLDLFPKNLECKCTAEYKRFMKTETVTLQFKELELSTKGNKIIGLSFSDINLVVNEIERLEDNSYSPLLTIYISKTSYTFKFISLSDKYFVKSLIYSTLLTSISRKCNETQLKLKVAVITWNLSEVNCPDNLDQLFINTPLDKVDILAIGCQKCSMIYYYKLMHILRAKVCLEGFIEVESESLLKMFLIVFIKKDLGCLVNRVEKKTKATGFANIIGNKGGIVISFSVIGYNYVFVNCHLAPKMYNVLERNKMAKNLVEAIKIGDKEADFDVLADYTFWFGDMNYRVDYCYSETINELTKNNLKLLIPKDQLSKQQKNNEIFSEFVEPEITFLPTYRRNRICKTNGDEDSYQQCENVQLSNNASDNSHLLEKTLLNNNNKNDIYKMMFSNKDNQSPSWCDRVLLKSQRKVKFLSYNSIENMRYSNHLPVVGYYSLYLTMPILTNLTQPSSYSLEGKIIYKNILLRYNYNQLKDWVDLKNNLTFRLQAYHFLQETPSKCVTKEMIETQDKDWLEITFPEMLLYLPPKMIFDYPQIKAFNIFFVITAIFGKNEVDIGFSKYSFESLDQSNNMMHHLQNLKVNYQLKNFGTLSFEANYLYGM